MHECRGVDTAAIVDYLDANLISRLRGIDLQYALRQLAACSSVVGGLDTVIDRVADDVDQRIADRLDHFAIDLDILAGDFERDRFVAIARGVANQPRQGSEQPVDRLHAGPRHTFTQLADDAAQPFEARMEIGVIRIAQGARELIAHEHELGHLVHHGFE